jgi:peptide/nickel transport system substrate-binding protein
VIAEQIRAALARVGISVEATALTDDALERRIRNGNYDLFVWGWVTEPDPDIVLSTLTCGERRGRGTNDTWFCTEVYDRLFERQRGELDPERRARLVRRLQLLAFDQVPYVVLYYQPLLQGYRTDRVTGWTPQPPAGALLLGPGNRSFLTVEIVGPRPQPAAASVEPPSAGVIADALDSDRLWLFVAAGAIAISVLGGLLLFGRSARVLDREAALERARPRRPRREGERQRREEGETLALEPRRRLHDDGTD